MNPWSAKLDEEPILLAQAHADSPAGKPVHAGSMADSSAATSDTHHSEHASQWVFFSYSMVALLLILVVVAAGTRKMRLVPHGLQNFLEWIYESLFGIPEMVMGPRGRKYAPLIASFFLYIVVMNFLALIPAFKPGTASLSVTLGLAIVAFISVQYFGFQAHGIRYLAHFVGPVPGMFFLILPLELVAELVRPVSLSIRLYGNIYGEEQVVSALASQLHPMTAVVILPIQILSSFLQAYVFALLVTVYISLATERHAHNEGSASDEDEEY